MEMQLPIKLTEPNLDGKNLVRGQLHRPLRELHLSVIDRCQTGSRREMVEMYRIGG